MNILKYLSVALIATVMFGSVALSSVKAQSYDYTTDYSYDYGTSDTLTDEEASVLGFASVAVWGVSCCIGLIMYVFMALALQSAAKKVGITENLWMAWVPIAQYFLMANIAGLEVLHAIISIFFSPWLFYVMYKMYERRGLNPMLVLLQFVPIGNLVGIYMLGWSESSVVLQK